MNRVARVFLAACLLLAVRATCATLAFRVRPDSCRFAVIGDSGTGDESQYLIGQRMAEYREEFPFDFVIMLGDNIYGSAGPVGTERKFERPYEPLLEAGVKFFASLGNHDNPNEAFYKPFNMNGDRFYTFRSVHQSVRFFVLDSNYLTPVQLQWLDNELGRATEDWKIAYFHHPLYNTGVTHGPELALRKVLEPVLVRHGVSAVFSGHEHVYQRLRAQKGIYYFVAGSAGKLSTNDLRAEEGVSAAGFDEANVFMLVQITGDDLDYQAISESGATVDSGTLSRPRGQSVSAGSGSSDRSAPAAPPLPAAP